MLLNCKADLKLINIGQKRFIAKYGTSCTSEEPVAMPWGTPNQDLIAEQFTCCSLTSEKKSMESLCPVTQLLISDCPSAARQTIPKELEVCKDRKG